eukprot:11620621-Prorocentrum_lima.AAC.1
MLSRISEEANLPADSFYIKKGVTMLSDWAGATLRRYTDDENLDICLRLKGGNPETANTPTMDDKLAIYM